MRVRLLGLVLGAWVLAGCAVDRIVAPDIEVQRRAYVSQEPSELVLYTVINNRSGQGAHTALMINGSQRVLWDPAGSFQHPHVPEQNDLLYGYTPLIEKVYLDYHARETYRIVEQRLLVPAQLAEEALQLAAQNGSASQATCALTTSRILASLPGMQDVTRTWYPKQLMQQFAQMPGVQTRVITDDDADDNHNVIFVAEQEALAEEGR